LREKEVLSLIVEGNTSKKIAKQLNISLSTIKTHRHSIMKKLNIHDVASLTRLAMQKGFDTIAG
jgi:two-component system NarL family response regulator